MATSKSGPGRLNERAFAKLVQERLIDSEEACRILGLAGWGSLRKRVANGNLSGPVIVQPRGYALWDRVQVEREGEAAKKKMAPVERP